MFATVAFGQSTVIAPVSSASGDLGTTCFLEGQCYVNADRLDATERGNLNCCVLGVWTAANLVATECYNNVTDQEFQTVLGLNTDGSVDCFNPIIDIGATVGDLVFVVADGTPDGFQTSSTVSTSGVGDLTFTNSAADGTLNMSASLSGGVLYWDGQTAEPFTITSDNGDLVLETLCTGGGPCAPNTAEIRIKSDLVYIGAATNANEIKLHFVSQLVTETIEYDRQISKFVFSVPIFAPEFAGQTGFGSITFNDDDCTGNIGDLWYDTTDLRFELCNANSGAPLPLIGGTISAPNYSQSFSSQTTVTLTHALGTKNLSVECYGSTDIIVVPDTLDIDGSDPWDVVVTFFGTQSGRCVVNGFGSDGRYVETFTAQTTISIPGATHLITTNMLTVDCYSDTDPRIRVMPDSVSADDGTNDIVITFFEAETGKCVLR